MQLSMTCWIRPGNYRQPAVMPPSRGKMPRDGVAQPLERLETRLVASYDSRSHPLCRRDGIWVCTSRSEGRGPTAAHRVNGWIDPRLMPYRQMDHRARTSPTELRTVAAREPRRHHASIHEPCTSLVGQKNDSRLRWTRLHSFIY